MTQKHMLKTKNCPKCELDLPIEAFTSTRAKYCNSCGVIRKMEQQKASRQRQIERLKTQKTEVTNKKKEKTVAQLKKHAQRVFNAWIRERDKYMPCISCGVIDSNSWQAGHFWAMGSNGSLRYHELNCHKQCVSCNMFKSGNLLEYRFGLIKKIGTIRLDWLDNNRHETKKWTREELLEIIERYK